jgi:hypothetical protein
MLAFSWPSLLPLLPHCDSLVYSTTANALSNEAGIEAESTSIAQFRQAVLQGHWTEVSRLLKTIDADYEAHETVRCCLSHKSAHL